MRSDFNQAAGSAVDGLEDQVEQNLVERHRVERQVGQPFGELALQIDIILRTQRIREVEHLGDLFFQVCRIIRRGLAHPGQLTVERRLTVFGFAGYRNSFFEIVANPQQVGQFFDSGALFAAQLAVRYAQLVGDNLLAELLDVAAKQRVVDTPGTRLVGFIGGRFEGFDPIHQDFAQGGGGIEFVGEIE